MLYIIIFKRIQNITLHYFPDSIKIKQKNINTSGMECLKYLLIKLNPKYEELHVSDQSGIPIYRWTTFATFEFAI